MTDRLRHHHFSIDPDVPADEKGRRFCLCELREDHPIHDMPPAPPGQAAHRKRVGDGE